MIEHLINYVNEIAGFIERFGCLPEDAFDDEWEAIMDGLQQDIDEEKETSLRNLRGY